MGSVQLRHIEIAVRKTFEGLIDVSDRKFGEAQTQALLTRGLAAFALTKVAGVDPVEAALSVVDGPGDNGVDAVRVDLSEQVVYLLQAKWFETGNGSPSVGDCHKFAKGVRDLLNGQLDRFNDRMRAIEGEILAALDHADTRFELFLVYSGAQELSPEASMVFSDLLAEVNDTSPLATFRSVNQSDLHKFVRGSLSGESAAVDVAIRDWGHVSDPFEAYYGQVSGEEIARWLHDFGASLFDKNIRSSLRDSSVNKGIEDTIVQRPEDFWYFNNGVTILCDRISKKPMGGSDRSTGYFQVVGPSVVNGAQTITSLYRAWQRSPGALGKVWVPVRFISLDSCPEDFAQDVTRATNTQNRVGSRDFVALDENQTRLKTDMQLEFEKLYTVKSGEPDPEPADGCSLVEATVALACSCDDVELSVQVKREIGKLWDDVTKAPYLRIFNASTTASDVWNAVRIQRVIDKKLGELRRGPSSRRGIVTHGNRLVAHLVFWQIANEAGRPRPSQWEVSESNTWISELTQRTVLTVERLINESFQGQYLASLFKNYTKCRELAALFVEAQGDTVIDLREGASTRPGSKAKARRAGR